MIDINIIHYRDIEVRHSNKYFAQNVEEPDWKTIST